MRNWIRTAAWIGLTAAATYVVADVKAVEAPAKPVRLYRPMWRLGDWPSRYRVTAE